MIKRVNFSETNNKKCIFFSTTGIDLYLVEENSFDN